MSQWVTADTSRKSRSHGGPRVPWIALVVVFLLHCPLSTFLTGLGMILGASRADFQMMPGHEHRIWAVAVRIEQSPRPL